MCFLLWGCRSPHVVFTTCFVMSALRAIVLNEILRFPMIWRSMMRRSLNSRGQMWMTAVKLNSLDIFTVLPVIWNFVILLLNQFLVNRARTLWDPSFRSGFFSHHVGLSNLLVVLDVPKICEEKTNKCEIAKEVGATLAELPSATWLGNTVLEWKDSQSTLQSPN